jgi:Ring finger domain
MEKKDISERASSVQTGDKCPICLETFDNSHVNLCYTQCGHLFHTSCLIKSLENAGTCPICRNRLIISGDEEKTHEEGGRSLAGGTGASHHLLSLGIQAEMESQSSNSRRTTETQLLPSTNININISLPHEEELQNQRSMKIHAMCAGVFFILLITISLSLRLF